MSGKVYYHNISMLNEKYVQDESILDITCLRIYEEDQRFHIIIWIWKVREYKSSYTLSSGEQRIQ